MSTKKVLPHVTAVLVFLIVTLAYLYPVLQGQTIYGGDTQSYIGMSKEATDYNATHDDQALWTNSMFGGMPTYQICMDQPDTVLKYIDSALRLLPGPSYRVFLYLIGFYVMLLLFGVNPYLAIAGSVAFAFGSYNLIIIVAGHNTKAVAIAYMAPILASIYYALRKNPWVGSALLAFFLGMGLYANHVQIIYYTLFMAICLGISELVFAIKEKNLPDFFKRIGILCLGALLAVGLNATRLMTTQEYVKATMRGESNGLTVENSDAHGLDKDYITAWSYGVKESMTLLIPDFMGGPSAGELDENSATGQAFGERTGLRALGRELTDAEKARIDRTVRSNPEAFQPRNLAELMYSYSMPLYWGDQPFTAGPVYVGAIVVFLFVLGLMVVPARQRWWLLAAAILGLVLSWGRNFMWLTDFFIDYVPLYNKFRTVSMTLVITCLAMCIMAVLALREMFGDRVETSKKLKSLYISGGITAGVCLLYAIFPSFAGDFVAPGDGAFTGDYAFLQESLIQDRCDMLAADAMRSFAFIIVAAGLLLLYLKRVIRSKMATVMLVGILMAADMIGVGLRYLNKSDFVKNSDVQAARKPSPADDYILADRSLDFRVLDLSVDVFNSSDPSYFHKNVGGYSAVKMRRYQELIDVQLAPEINRFVKGLREIADESQVDSLFAGCNILNMLNTKYVIFHPQAIPLLNKHAYGNAWLVDRIRYASTPDEEISLLDDVDLRHVLVMDEKYVSEVPENRFNTEGADIQLVSYSPNRLEYVVNAPTPQMAVFSEMFYYTGWKATMGEEELPILRGDYLLRAVYLPAGKYNLTFSFSPSSYTVGNALEITASVLLTLAFACIIFAYFRKRKQGKATAGNSVKPSATEQNN